MKNNCIIEKKFLFWRWKAIEHQYKMFCISKFMDSSTTFHVTWKCECGAIWKQKFVSQDELLLKGISIENLNKIDGWNSHYCRKEKK